MLLNLFTVRENINIEIHSLTEKSGCAQFVLFNYALDCLLLGGSELYVETIVFNGFFSCGVSVNIDIFNRVLREVELRLLCHKSYPRKNIIDEIPGPC